MPKKGYKQTIEAKMNTMRSQIEYHKNHPEVAKKVGLEFTAYWASEKGQAQKVIHSKLMTGRKQSPRSEEWNKKISESKKGSIPWNKGKFWNEEIKAKLRGSRPNITGKNHPMWGKHCSEKTKEKMRIKLKGKFMGENNPAWKGGVVPINILIRNGSETAVWRKAVFERDNYTCQDCGDNRGGNLNAHHFKSFAEYPELRFDVDNGLTLCEDCHTKIHPQLRNLSKEMRI